MEAGGGILLEIDRLGAVVRDERPWGGFERYTLNEPSTVKIIEVAPGHRFRDLIAI